RGSAQGTIQALLYDGTTLIGTGHVNTVDGWANYTDTFTGLSVTNANNLRTKIKFHNTAGTGAIRYTEIWLKVTITTSSSGAGGSTSSSSASSASSASSVAASSAASSGSGGSGGGDPQPSFPIRAAFYYPWFPEAWTQGGVYP